MVGIVLLVEFEVEAHQLVNQVVLEWSSIGDLAYV